MNIREAAMIADNDLRFNGGAEINARHMLRFGKDETRWKVYSPFPLPEDTLAYTLITPPGFHHTDLKLNVINPRLLQDVIDDIRTTNPDVIVLNHPYSYGAQLFGLMSEEMRAKTVVIWRQTVDHTLTKAAPETLSGKTLMPVLDSAVTTLWAFIGKHSAGGIAFSNATKESLVRIGIHPDKIRVIQDQVSFDMDSKVRNSPDYQTNRQQYLDDDQLGILSVGRINKRKNFRWIVDTYEELLKKKKEFPNTGEFTRIKFTLAGPVDSQSEQEELALLFAKIDEIHRTYGASDKVSIEYSGSKSHEELYSMYNAYDIQLLTSLFEGSSNVLKEAAKGGMALMAAKQADAAVQLITEANTNVGIALDSPSHTALHLLNCLKNPALLRHLQENSTRWSSQFTQERAEEEFWNAVYELLS